MAQLQPPAMRASNSGSFYTVEPDYPDGQSSENSMTEYEEQANLLSSNDAEAASMVGEAIMWREALQRIKIHQCAKTIDQNLTQSKKPGSQKVLGLPDYKKDINRLQQIAFLSAEEYRIFRNAGRTFEGEAHHTIVLATPQQARNLLQTENTPINILIPSELNANHMEFENITSLVSKSANMEKMMVLQDYRDSFRPGRQLEAEQTFSQPSHDEFRRRLRKGELARFVDLNNKNAGVTKFLRGIKQLQALRRAANDRLQRKRQLALDIGASQEFWICGGEDAWSMPRIDRHGVTTIITIHEGEMLWVTWGRLTHQEKQGWGEAIRRGDSLSPASNPCAIFLQKGDTLIQPAGTVHAPYFLSASLIHETMHWDTRGMDEVIWLSGMEQRYGLSGEDAASDIDELFTSIEFEIKQQREGEGRALWKWGGEEGAKRLEAQLSESWSEHRLARRRRDGIICSCSPDCATDCVCQASSLPCLDDCRGRGAQSRCRNHGTPSAHHPPPIVVAGVEQWEVERILAVRQQGRILRYRVKWVGWEDDRAWYPASNFRDAPHLIRDFHKDNPSCPGPPRRLQEWIQCWERDEDAEEYEDDDRA